MKNKAMNCLFWFGTFFTLFVPIVIAILTDNKNASWLSFLCGGFVILVSKFNELAELSLGPLKAKMRDTIKEALATLEQLREIAATSAKAQLTDSMASNFRSGTTLEQRLNLKEDIVKSLNSIGVPKQKIKDVTKMWNQGIGLIYHRGIKDALEGRDRNKNVRTQVSNEVRLAVQELQKMLKFDEWKAPTPYEIETLINERGVMKIEVQNLIEDYRHFLETGNINRREIFIKL